MRLWQPQWLGAFTLIALLWSCVSAQWTQSAQENDAYIRGWDGLYHTLEDMDAAYSSIAQQAPQRLRLLPIQDNVTSNGYQKLQIGEASSETAAGQANVVYIMCQQHAREVIAAEYCYWLVRLLTDTNTTTLLEWPEFQSQLGLAPRFRGQGAERVSAAQLAGWISSIVVKVQVQVIPVVNRAGAQLVQSGRFALRKAPDTQVDLNRNWPGTFSTAATDPEANPSAETYRGPAALSEWQTRTIHNDLLAVRPAVLLDVHSGIWSMLAPWASRFSLSDVPEAQLAHWQKLLHAGNAHTNIAAGPSAPLLYAARGGAVDNYLTFRKEATAFTFEIHGAASDADGRNVQCPTLAEFAAACSSSGCGTVRCFKRTANGGINVFDPQAAAAANTLSAGSVAASPGQAAAVAVQADVDAAAAAAAARTRNLAVPRAGHKLLQERLSAMGGNDSSSSSSSSSSLQGSTGNGNTNGSDDSASGVTAMSGGNGAAGAVSIGSESPASTGSSSSSSVATDQAGLLRLESAIADASADGPSPAPGRTRSRRPPPPARRRTVARHLAPLPAAAATGAQGEGVTAAAAAAAAPPPPPLQLSTPARPASPAAPPSGLVPVTAAGTRAAGTAAEAALRSRSYVHMDPFMKNLQGNKEAYFWYYFNPSTPDTYRDVIARWMVATLAMLDAM